MMNANELLTTREAAKVLDLKPNTLAKWRAGEVGPAWVQIGRNVRYRRGDLSAWLEGNRVLPGMAVANGVNLR